MRFYIPSSAYKVIAHPCIRLCNTRYTQLHAVYSFRESLMY